MAACGTKWLEQRIYDGKYLASCLGNRTGHSLLVPVPTEPRRGSENARKLQRLVQTFGGNRDSHFSRVVKSLWHRGSRSRPTGLCAVGAVQRPALSRTAPGTVVGRVPGSEGLSGQALAICFHQCDVDHRRSERLACGTDPPKSEACTSCYGFLSLKARETADDAVLSRREVHVHPGSRSQLSRPEWWNDNRSRSFVFWNGAKCWGQCCSVIRHMQLPGCLGTALVGQPDR